MTEWIARMIAHADNGLLAALGGMVSYLYEYFKQAEVWSIARFFLHTFIALGVGMMLGSFVPDNAWARDGWLILVGYLSFSVLELLDKHKLQAVEWVTGILKRVK